jgi:diguanylate cyclase (GGDEF)-like protein
MRLFAQTSAIIATLLLFSFGTALLTRQLIVLPQLQELEAQADRKDLRRVLLAIDAKKQQLATLAYQNAVWDGMYNYLAQRTAGFFANHFPIDTFLALNISAIALFDRDDQLVDQRVVTPQHTGFGTEPLPVADIRPHLIDLRKVHPRAPIFDSGVMATARGPLLYATASVMRSNTHSQARGNFLVAVDIDDEFVHEISEAAQLPVTLSPLPDNYSAPASPDQIYRDGGDRLFWLLKDNRDRPILLLALQLPPRDFDTELLWTPLIVAFIVSLIGYAGILVLVRQLLIDPIQTIGAHLRRVQENGDYSLRLDSERGNELGDVSRNIDTLVEHVQLQREQLQQQAAEMQALSYLDGLTGLANRRRFDQALVDNWALAQRARTPLALLMCDVDYFKSYNDHCGHQRGDEVLRCVADIIRRTVARHSDIAARYGGEEFAILLPDTGEDSAARIAERLLEDLRGAAIRHDHSPISGQLTLSIGVASLVPDASRSQRDLVRCADEALYSAKAGGRNQIIRASALPD